MSRGKHYIGRARLEVALERRARFQKSSFFDETLPPVLIFFSNATVRDASEEALYRASNSITSSQIIFIMTTIKETITKLEI